MLLSREGVSLLVWLVVFTVIITVVVAFRFWAASIKRRALRPDDYMIIVAYVSAASFFHLQVYRLQEFFRSARSL